MFKNSLLTILRGFRRNKVITFINIIGLTIGLAASILLIVLVKYEYSYDSFHKNKDSIYRVLSIIESQENNEKSFHAFAPSALGNYIRTSIPEFKDRVSITANAPKFKIDNMIHNEKALYVDNNFLKIFSFQMLKGNPETALSEPKGIILTKSFAKKLFGDKEKYNQLLTINKAEYKVTGIIEDVPNNSSIQFSALIPISSYNIYNALIDQWGNNLTNVYINLPDYLDKRSAENLINRLTENFKRPGAITSFALQPLSKIHLFSYSDYGIVSKGNITNLIIYTFLVIFLLTTAVINYTNISFNQIYKRSNEIGMRRILGATKKQIFYRNWIEALLTCSISLFLSLLIISLVLSNFNILFDRNIEFSFILSDILEIVSLLLLVSILLGLLPTIKLIKTSNPRTLKNGVELSSSNKSVKGMLIIQFAITFFFLIAAFLVSEQLRFIASQHSIKENENIIQVRNVRDKKISRAKIKSFYQEIAQNDVIINSTFSEGTGRRDYYETGEFSLLSQKEMCYIEKVQKNYFSMFDHKIKIGRSLNLEKFPSDSINSIMVNETFIRLFNIKNPLETTVTAGDKRYNIIGVVEDFTTFTLKYDIEPLVIMPVEKITDFYFEINKNNEKTALDLIKKEWKTFFPHEILTYMFYNETIMKDYKNEIIANKLFLILSLISIVLSLLGTLGLLSLMLVKRKKEIAIRKVLGASIKNLIVNLSKEFMLAIFIGFIIASVLSYNYINKFLESFVYKAAVSLTTFIFAFVIVIVLVLSTIIIQSLKSLYTNPADSLRND